MEIKDLKQITDQAWEGCDGCDENDEYFWKKGFMAGYMRANTELSDEEIDMISKKEIWYNEDKRCWIIEGMKLYREQLKQRQ